MDLEKTLKIRCTGEMTCDWKELKPFQGDLKTITKEDFQDLKESLKKHGLPFGFDIWIDEKGTRWIQDGHHRILAFAALEDEGWFIPPVPCNRVFAKNRKEAAMTLLIRNGRWAKISQESISDFMIENGLQMADLEFLSIPDFDLNDFNLDLKDVEIEDLDAVDENFNFIIKCESHEQFKRVQEFFETDASKVRFKTIEAKICE